jgi:hypothetical protein
MINFNCLGKKCIIIKGGYTMDKLLFCNLDLLKKNFDNEDYPDYDFSSFDYEKLENERKEFLTYFKELSEDTDNKVFFYSRKRVLLNNAKEHFDRQGYTNFKYKDRSQLREFVVANSRRNNYFVFIGGKNKDFEMAVNSKSLYIAPTWLPLESNPSYYGVRVDTSKQLYKFILTLNNQNRWYSELKIDDKITSISLMDARSRFGARTFEEREMLENFQRLLKNGTNRSYYELLLYHFLANMTNTNMFDDIELFGMIPSSNCTLNPDMFNFMTQVRYIKGKRLPTNALYQVPNEQQNLIIRHSPKRQMHSGDQSERQNIGATAEFATICINPKFETKIENLKREGRFNVCIFDDYMDYGNSFNAVRCLLESIGVNKIIFVSMGLFRKSFQKRDYTITGSVYGGSYTYNMNRYSVLNDFDIEENTKQEVSDLYNIFNA